MGPHKHKACAPAVVAAVLAAMLALPATAFGLTTDKATAKPNEDGGSGVIGGMDTRLTWEGTVEDGENVTSVTLSLPEDASFDGSSTRITVLEGLNRVNVDGRAKADGGSVTVDFAEPVPAGSLLRLEVTGMKFPAAGGDYSVEGSYTTDRAKKDLAPSSAISIIANTPLQSIVNWLDEQPWVEAWNSNQFLGMFFKPQLLVTSFSSLFPGWLLCLGIVVACYPFAIVLGLLFSLLKISKHRLCRAIAVVYINILRGTPLFLQIYIMFFGLPMVGINIDNNLLGIIVMAVNSSAYLAEIFRAGIQSIDKGQMEAGRSLGMTWVQTMRYIIVPQAFKRVIPPLGNEFIALLKDSSLVSVIGFEELTRRGQLIIAKTYGSLEIWISVAVIYLAMTLTISRFVAYLERRYKTDDRH